MKSISREDYGYYEAPVDWEEVNDARERKETHDESEQEEKQLSERRLAISLTENKVNIT